MQALLTTWLLLSPAAISYAQQQEVTYGFATKDYVIEMTVSFPDPYLGRRLVFYHGVDPTKEVCYADDGSRRAKCVDRFVGAVALVRYSVKLLNGSTPAVASIREHVTVIGQSPGLPEKAPFSRTQKLVKGIGSDVQVFGYDELSVKEADRARAREQSQAGQWRLYRQELSMDRETKPFAIVEWKHTLNRISIVRIYSPSDRE